MSDTEPTPTESTPTERTPTERRVRYETSAGTMTITLDSPQNRNALSRQLRAELAEALDEAASNDDVRVVILTHTGPTFCAGMDLKETVQEKPGEEAVRDLPQLLKRVAHCPKPVIGALHGSARGGGVGLVASCDLVVAAESANFALPEVRVGLIPSTVSVPVLAKMPLAVVREMMLTGEALDARRAQAAGLISSVTSGDDVIPTAQRYRDSVLLGGPGALAGTKRLLAPLLHDDDARYDAMLDLSAEQFNTPEAREGARAFAEKRRASWMPDA